jgi:hypothetical protein
LSTGTTLPLEGKEQHHVVKSHRFAGLESLDDDDDDDDDYYYYYYYYYDISRAWETIRISKFQSKRV